MTWAASLLSHVYLVCASVCLAVPAFSSSAHVIVHTDYGDLRGTRTTGLDYNIGQGNTIVQQVRGIILIIIIMMMLIITIIIIQIIARSAVA